MRKSLSILLALALLVTSLAGCGSKPAASSESTAPASESTATSAAPAEKVKIRVAYHAGLNGCMVPGIDSIEGNRFFEQEGLDVEWVKFTSGPPEVAAMVSGDIQFGYIGHGAHTLAVENKINIISLHSLGNSEKLYVRKDSGIAKVEDLKGKTIATQLGTSGEVLLNLALNKAGMKKEDVKIMNMDMAGAVAAFIAKQVDAISCWDIHATNVVEKVGEANLTLLTRTGDYADVAAFPASWTATPEYIEKNRDVVVRFIKALNKCYDYRAKNLDESVKAAAKFGEADVAVFEKSKGDFQSFDSAQLKEMIGLKSLQSIYKLQLDYFIKDGKVKEGNVDQYVRTDLMEEAYK